LEKGEARGAILGGRGGNLVNSANPPRIFNGKKKKKKRGEIWEAGFRLPRGGGKPLDIALGPVLERKKKGKRTGVSVTGKKEQRPRHLPVREPDFSRKRKKKPRGNL